MTGAGYITTPRDPAIWSDRVAEMWPLIDPWDQVMPWPWPRIDHWGQVTPWPLTIIRVGEWLTDIMDVYYVTNVRDSFNGIWNYIKYRSMCIWYQLLTPIVAATSFSVSWRSVLCLFFRCLFPFAKVVLNCVTKGMKYDDVAAAWASIAACTACSSAVSLLISSLCGVDGDGDDEDAEDDDVVDGNDAAGAGSSSMHFASMSAGSISSPSQSKSSWPSSWGMDDVDLVVVLVRTPFGGVIVASSGCAVLLCFSAPLGTERWCCRRAVWREREIVYRGK